MKVFFLTFFSVIYFTATSQTDDFQNDIIDYLNVNGTFQKYDFEFEKILINLNIKAAAKDTPNSFWVEIAKDKKVNVNELIKILSFAYRKYYTQEEICDLLEFYKTEAAQKMISGNKNLSSKEIKIIEKYRKSNLAMKANKTSLEFKKDSTNISNQWIKEVFAKKLGALAKAGHTK